MNIRVFRDERVEGHMNGNEMVNANLFWIKSVQEDIFAKEIRVLTNVEDLARKNKLNYLSPFLGGNTGLIMVGGRMHRPSLPEETKNPVIFPR